MSTGLSRVFGYPMGVVKKAFTATASEQALTPTTTYRFLPTEDCHVSFIASGGTAATAAHCLLKAGVPEVFTIRAPVDAVSVIRDSADGSLYINEMFSGGI